ncbi:RNA-binding transcriptional accessory protein [Clostridium sporogenes]|uniref:RNA-binding transcriptional accessory protein n=1 Tax=Clostridium botulinum TaxID=1491 RepID=A0A6M0T0H4_CLOBO|nr:Tex family protein [Clostridium sporogenes]NFA60665.1 RNA-binding transcriptional accessory protein [Clostridium botulinum]NFI74115.1 RNA-binding transcriptional accessory protein [Clostridium sporogenes]NFL71829.1 RNA-binding transcriptional accessory protein [Clostridium sporogenes]NFM23991.1 RNA-binding transcriptional accessory protein [Clostridium sporogenes]NFP61989.1 RNA-binding transcriptional accessory protein [Clostridium sporogenes]
MNNINSILSKELNISIKYIDAVIDLLDQGNTVPFIARYRKEVTGGMSDETLRELFERLTYLRNLSSKKEDVIRLIDEQGKLTEELKASVLNCKTVTEVDDLYRPYRPKRRTRATIAEEKGLKPLAKLILEGNFKEDIKTYASEFINEEKEVKTVEDALQGAMDIISEIISDEAEYRKWIRNFVFNEGVIETKGESEEPTPYEMYYDYKENVKTIPPHRILAINRGEKEKILAAKITCNEDRIVEYLKSKALKNNKETDVYIEDSIKDSLKRLIYPSIEREIRSELTEKGEEGAIKIFKENLRALLMQAPIKDKVVLGYDPGFRTGCKIAVLDETGKLLDTATVYATAPQNDVQGSIKILKELIYKHDVDVISLGNGTASRESEEVISRMLKEIKEEKGKDICYVIVSEAGASVYSASKLATEEYPDINVSLRGAISIGRRLQDPLAELVKIDPKSIGVGQYQHDVSQKKLDESLKGIVEDCVNAVGVDLNTATPSLLSYISGINTSIAKNIVAYREEVGKFKSRKELLKVKRLGQKAFEQCAGFLRVMESKEPLDNTGVHPESYDSTKKFLSLLEYDINDVKNNKLQDIDSRVSNIGIDNICGKIDIGKPTLLDIIKEIKKPGRDPREDLPKPILKTGIVDITQLKPDMILMGTVRNVADFGAFVDIGVHQDGLVHISQLSDSFVKHPLDIVKVGDIVEVRILEVDQKRNRISLSMKK